MTSHLTRRDFLTLAAGAATWGQGHIPLADARAPSAATDPVAGLSRPDQAPFDTVVVLMMENRSFDHLLGWLPGAKGRHHGLRFADSRGPVHETYPLAPEWQGCSLSDPDHSWQGS